MKKTMRSIGLLAAAFALLLLCACAPSGRAETLTEDELKAALDYYPYNEEALRAGKQDEMRSGQWDIIDSWRTLKDYLDDTYPETAYELHRACAATPGIPGGSDADAFYVRMEGDEENTKFEVTADEQGGYTVTYDGCAEANQGSKG